MSFKPFVIENPENLNAQDLTTLARQHGLVVIRQQQSFSKDDWRTFCKPFGDFLEWDFGDVNELIIKPESGNYLYSSEPVPMHWDGAFAKSPSLLMFYCKHSEGIGGETLFADTQSIMKQSSEDEITSWRNTQLRYQTEKLVHYGGEFTTSMIDKHPHTQQDIIRFAEPVKTDKNPVALTVEGACQSDPDFIKNMQTKLYSPYACYAHTWEPGDIVIADNHRLLHGRHALSQNTARHIYRIQII